tara:strand:- start:637 stop:828 length:192 start_codon:yes stop_codon:yes gene_type:complete
MEYVSMNSTLFTDFVAMHGEDQSLGGGFGQALQNNDTDIALKIADVKNTKKLKILLNEMGKLL